MAGADHVAGRSRRLAPVFGPDVNWVSEPRSVYYREGSASLKLTEE